MNLRRVLEGKVWEGIHGLCMGENRFSSFGALYASPLHAQRPSQCQGISNLLTFQHG